jgi:hypothetical protein
MPKGGKQIPSAHDGRPVALYVRVPSLYRVSSVSFHEHGEKPPKAKPTISGRTVTELSSTAAVVPEVNFAGAVQYRYRLQPVLTGPGGL